MQPSSCLYHSNVCFNAWSLTGRDHCSAGPLLRRGRNGVLRCDHTDAACNRREQAPDQQSDHTGHCRSQYGRQSGAFSCCVDCFAHRISYLNLISGSIITNDHACMRRSLSTTSNQSFIPFRIDCISHGAHFDSLSYVWHVLHKKRPFLRAQLSFETWQCKLSRSASWCVLASIASRTKSRLTLSDGRHSTVDGNDRACIHNLPLSTGDSSFNATSNQVHFRTECIAREGLPDFTTTMPGAVLEPTTDHTRVHNFHLPCSDASSMQATQ